MRTSPCHAYISFFFEMEVCPRPLLHDDACGPFIKNSESNIIKVLQLANGANSKHKRSEKEKWPKNNRYGDNKDELSSPLSCYANFIRIG